MSDAAVTDAILALVTLGMGLRLLWRRGGPEIGGVGLVLVGVAAVFGTLRFSGVDSLVNAHWGVTRLASLVGVPLVGVAYVTTAFGRRWSFPIRRYSFVVLLVAAVALIAQPLWGQIVGGLGMLLVVVGAAAGVRTHWRIPVFGWLGAVLTLVAGLVIVGEGSWGPVSRMAWFHLALAAGGACLGLGLLAWPDLRPLEPTNDVVMTA